MTLQVTDSNGGVGTATTTVTLGSGMVRMNNVMYPSLQTAYNVALNNSVIQLVTGAATGGLIANRNMTVTLSGGFDTRFTAAAGVTAIQGPVTVKLGKVIMRNVRLMPAPLLFTTASPLPGYTLGSGAYSTTIAAAGGFAPYTYAITAGAQPTGLTLAPGGLLSGIPTTAGAYSFTVTVTDSSGVPVSSSAVYTMTVLP